MASYRRRAVSFASALAFVFENYLLRGICLTDDGQNCLCDASVQFLPFSPDLLSTQSNNEKAEDASSPRSSGSRTPEGSAGQARTSPSVLTSCCLKGGGYHPQETHRESRDTSDRVRWDRSRDTSSPYQGLFTPLPPGQLPRRGALFAAMLGDTAQLVSAEGQREGPRAATGPTPPLMGTQVLAQRGTGGATSHRNSASLGLGFLFQEMGRTVNLLPCASEAAGKTGEAGHPAVVTGPRKAQLSDVTAQNHLVQKSGECTAYHHEENEQFSTCP